MKALVVYDSVYGNTEKIARAIGAAIAADVRVLRAAEVSPSELGAIDLLVVGSPTHGGKPTESVQEFLSRISPGALKNVRVTSFDTRVKVVIARLFGYAAGRIAGGLKGKGGRLVAPPQGFIVKGNEGPLAEGELERATNWAKGIAAASSQKSVT